MSETPVTSEELSKSINAAINPDDIRAALAAEAEKQQKAATDQTAADAAAKAVADKAAADKAAADAEAAKAVTSFTRTETIGGKEFTFEAESELELERMVTNAYKVATALYQESTPAATDPAKEAAEKVAAAKAAEDQAAARVELELKFKRGEITANDYIEQSGAVKDYLEKQGVPLDELKASVEQNRSRGFEQSWADATQEFLKSAAGADWPGGPKNLEIIGLKIASLGLVEASDKVAALAQAYQSMKQSGMIFPADTSIVEKTDAEKTADATKAAADAAATKAAAAATISAAAVTQRTTATSSSIFGASSGVGAGTTERAVASKIEIPKDASPAELLQLWKEQQVKDGKDPNSAFIDTFASRRA